MLRIRGLEELPQRAVVTGTNERGKEYLGAHYLGGLLLFTAPLLATRRGALLEKPELRLAAAHMMLALPHTKVAALLHVAPGTAYAYNYRASSASNGGGKGLMETLLQTDPPELVIARRIPADRNVLHGITEADTRLIYLLNQGHTIGEVAIQRHMCASNVSTRLRALREQLPDDGIASSKNVNNLVGAAAILGGIGEYANLPVANSPGKDASLTVRELA